MNSFKRRQLQQLVYKLPESKLDDAIITMTEILERLDYAQYYQGMIILDPNNNLHVKRMLDMVEGLDSAAAKKRPFLKLVAKNEHCRTGDDRTNRQHC